MSQSLFETFVQVIQEDEDREYQKRVAEVQTEAKKKRAACHRVLEQIGKEVDKIKIVDDDPEWHMADLDGVLDALDQVLRNWKQ